MGGSKYWIGTLGFAAFIFGVLLGAITYTPTFPSSLTSPLPTLTRESVKDAQTAEPSATRSDPTKVLGKTLSNKKITNKGAKPRIKVEKPKVKKRSQQFEMRLNEGGDN